MIGDEKRVVDAFAAWLTENGWSVRTEVDFCDVVAERNGERLFAEAKGRTTSAGLDVDTMYGQLLRRMPLEQDEAVFAVVTPAAYRTAVLRVPRRVRELLRIAVYLGDDDGRVEEARD